MQTMRQMGGLGIGATMDVAYRDGFLYAVQSGAYPVKNPVHNGRLVVVDARDSAAPKVCGVLEGIGSARQIELDGSIAYITAREDGLLVADIGDPYHPKLVSRYDTVEYATGLAVANGLCVVSLRQYGLELIDARDPARLRHIGLIRTGEAQSLWIDGHHVYAGVWGTKELVIADIERPAAPRVVARAPLDGRGDGVTVRNGICYAATGQHARGPEGERLGNGLELLDVRDPARPVRLSGVKFPPYYGLTFDMWDVQLAGDTALVSNTRNGLYVVDVADPMRPCIVSSVRLPRLPDGTHEPITGFALDGSRLFVAGGAADTYLFACDQPLAPAYAMRAEVCPGAKTAAFELETVNGSPMRASRALEGWNVRFVERWGGLLYAACSAQGVAVVDALTFAQIGHIPTEGFAYTVRRVGEYLFIAEHHAGMAVYKIEGDRYRPVARHRAPGGLSVLDLLPSGDGRLMLLQVASLGVEMLDISRPETPRAVGDSLSYIGLFYGRHFPSRAQGNRFFFAVNRDGCFSVEPGPDGLSVRQLPYKAGQLSFTTESGLELLGEDLLCLHAGEYVLMREGEPPSIKGPIEGAALGMGVPRAGGGLLVVAERSTGHIVIAEMQADLHARCLCEMQTTGSPDVACVMPETVYIPLGHQGLLVIEREEIR